MDDITEEMALFDATCHVEGCENKDITIRIWASKANPIVVCGAHLNGEGLNEAITDVVPVKHVA